MILVIKKTPPVQVPASRLSQSIRNRGDWSQPGIREALAPEEWVAVSEALAPLMRGYAQAPPVIKPREIRWGEI